MIELPDPAVSAALEVSRWSSPGGFGVPDVTKPALIRNLTWDDIAW